MDGDFTREQFTLAAASEDEGLDRFLSPPDTEARVIPTIEPKTDFTHQDRMAVSIQMQIYVQDRVRIHKVGVTISYHPIGSFLRNLITTLEENGSLDEPAKSKPVLESLYIILSLLLAYEENPLLKAKLESGALVGTLIYTMYMIGLMTHDSYKAYRRTKESSDNAKSMNFETRVKLLNEFRRFLRKQIETTYGEEAIPTLSSTSWEVFRIALTGRKSSLRKKALNTLFEDYTHTKLSLVHNLEDYLAKPRAAVKGKQTNLSLARFFKDILVLGEKNKNNQPELLALYALAEHYVSGVDDAKLGSSVFLPVLIRGFALRLCPDDAEFLGALEGIKKLSIEGRALALAHLQDAIRSLLGVDEKILGSLNALFSKILTRDNEVIRIPLLGALYAYFNLSVQTYGFDAHIKDFAEKISLCPIEFHELFVQLYPAAKDTLEALLHKEVSDMGQIRGRLWKFTESMAQSDHPVAEPLILLANESCASGGIIPNLRAWALVIDYFLAPQNEKHLKKEKDKFVRRFIDGVGMTLYSAKKTLTDQQGKPLSLEDTKYFLEEFRDRITNLLAQAQITAQNQEPFRLLCHAVFTTKKFTQTLLLEVWIKTLLALARQSHDAVKAVQTVISCCPPELLAPLGLRAITRELSDVGDLFPDLEMVALLERQSETAAPLTTSSNPYLKRDSDDADKKGRESSSFFGSSRSSKTHTPASTLAASPAVTKKGGAETEEKKPLFGLNFLGKKKKVDTADSDDEDMKEPSNLSFSLSSSED
ncbi:MAG TPA: hypothetical protein VGV92_09625 [Gammaproteobacteria bacterium]|nr:hypothetical protein [Gammaproteobacteria bacterium]